MPGNYSEKDPYLSRLHEAKIIWESCSENGSLKLGELKYVLRMKSDISKRLEKIEALYKAGDFEGAHKKAYTVYAWAAVRSNNRTNIPFSEIREIFEELVNNSHYSQFSKRNQ